MDHRDEQTWVVVELSPLGETKLEEGTLEKSLRADLCCGPDHPIFLPVAVHQKNGKPCVTTLLEGYVFVASGLSELSYYALERKPYVSQVITTLSDTHQMRVLSTVPDKEIRKIRQKLRKKVSSSILTGDAVYAIDGIYRHLPGVVEGILGDSAFVRICLRSIKLVATIPLVSLGVGEPPLGDLE